MGHKSALVHFSGGADSTYCAAWAAEQFDHVWLVTYDRLSFIGSVNYTKQNYSRLCAIYGESRFTRRIINIEKLHQKICFENYFELLGKNGLAVTSLVFSKLAMHWTSAYLCKRYGISAVADGAVPYMDVYPDQNERIALSRLKEFFGKWGIEYFNPAYSVSDTIEQKLYDKGIIEVPEMRGTAKDKQVYYAEQVLLALFLKYYLTLHSQSKYEEVLGSIYENRLKMMAQYIDQNQAPRGLEKWLEVL
ncbi:MAG: 7-cyano-7-deazaguanine synthase [Oligoflexia bacterium]|nr:7-cyano-7-deazaguanine synthase [Oligoflexia bacterium]